MPGVVAYEKSLARLERIASAGPDPLSLRRDLVEELQRVVAFDAFVWLLTDPETTVGTSPLADVPARLVPELPRLVRLKYLTPVNRWTTLGPARVALLRDATGGHADQSLLWRQMLGPLGVGDIASIVFVDRYGCWGFLDLWRMGGSERFGAAERSYLSRAAPTLTAALRRSQAATFAHDHRRVPDEGPVVLLLSPDLTVRTQTPYAAEYLRTLVPPSGGEPPIPASAYNVAAQLLAVEAGVDRHQPSARVHLAGGLWVTLRAARIGEASAPTRRDIAVTIEPTPARDRASVFARAFGLGAREREVLDHVVAGLDTREVARRMVVSEHTVQDHLKSVFAKTGTGTRGALVSRAVGA